MQQKHFPDNAHMDNYSEKLGWEYLGSDSKSDYYINHQKHLVSVVYGEAPWEYESHPYFMLKKINALDKPLHWREAMLNYWKYCEICKAHLSYPDKFDGICEPCAISEGDQEIPDSCGETISYEERFDYDQ